MDNEELENLMTECVGIAKRSWEKNFPNYWNTGDSNRQAIGQIASTLFEYKTKQY